MKSTKTSLTRCGQALNQSDEHEFEWMNVENNLSSVVSRVASLNGMMKEEGKRSKRCKWTLYRIVRVISFDRRSYAWVSSQFILLFVWLTLFLLLVVNVGHRGLREIHCWSFILLRMRSFANYVLRLTLEWLEGDRKVDVTQLMNQAQHYHCAIILELQTAIFHLMKCRLSIS
jgi:hypothetical protein